MSIVIPAKKKIDFELEGQAFTMRKPSIIEHEDYVEAYQVAVTRKEKQDVLFNHLHALGMPIELAKSLDNEQLEFVIEKLTESKKN